MTRCNAGLLIFCDSCWSGASGRLRQAVQSCRHVRRGCQGGRSGQLGNRGAKPSAAPAAGDSLTAQDVLEKMAAAYKNASSYEDFGTVGVSPGADARTKRHAGQLLRGPAAAQQAAHRVLQRQGDLRRQAVVCLLRLRAGAGRAPRGPGQAQHEPPAGRRLAVFRAQRRRASAVAATPIAPGRRSDQEPDERLAGCHPRRARPDGRLRLLSRPREFAGRPGVPLDRSEDLRLAAVRGADCQRAAPGRRRPAGQPHLAGVQFRACPPGRRYRSEGLSVRHPRGREEDAGPRANRSLRPGGPETAGVQVRRSPRQAVEQPVACGQGGRDPLLANRCRGGRSDDSRRSSSCTQSTRTTTRWPCWP